MKGEQKMEVVRTGYSEKELKAVFEETVNHSTMSCGNCSCD